MNARRRKCVFLDRDGIVNKAPPANGYVTRWDDFHLFPEFADVLRTVHDCGYAAVIVTNQRGVAQGLMTLVDVEEIHGNLRKLLSARYSLDLLDILFCPHEEGACECRKPAPGMLLEAARRHDIDLESSWMIGDSERDVAAGRAAGCRTILVSAGKTAVEPDVRVKDMRELRSRMRELLTGLPRGSREAERGI